MVTNTIDCCAQSEAGFFLPSFSQLPLSERPSLMCSIIIKPTDVLQQIQVLAPGVEGGGGEGGIGLVRKG